MRLQDKVVLITGAAGAIGAAAARLFAGQGAKLMLADMNADALQGMVEELGADNTACVSVDVTNPEQNEAMVAATVERFGRLDVFLANAGIEGKIGSLVESSVENFDKVMSVNVRGVWLGLHYAIPAMQKSGGGSIVITSSGAGVKGAPNLVPYNTSKHAVIGLMRCAALECAAMNIRVNTVNPGPIQSRMMTSIGDGFGDGNAFTQAVQAQTPLGRFGLPEEVAQTMLFLASDDSSYVTGSVYMVDGGNAT